MDSTFLVGYIGFAFFITKIDFIHRHFFTKFIFIVLPYICYIFCVASKIHHILYVIRVNFMGLSSISVLLIEKPGVIVYQVFVLWIAYILISSYIKAPLEHRCRNIHCEIGSQHSLGGGERKTSRHSNSSKIHILKNFEKFLNYTRVSHSHTGITYQRNYSIKQRICEQNRNQCE